MSVDPDAVAMSTAASVYRKYRDYTSLEDLQQEARLWLFLHEARVNKHLADAEHDGAAANWIARDISGALTQYARKDKAQASGYSPEDEQFYSRALLEVILPAVFRGDREPPSAAPDGMPRAKKDAALGGDYLAMWLDVESAWRALLADDVDLANVLALRYEAGYTYDKLAEVCGYGSTSTAHSAVRRAEDRIIEHLGGHKPRGCGHGCEHLEHDEALRRRPTGREEVW